MLDNYGGQNVTAYQFDLLYNPDILQPTETAADKNGTLSSDFAVETNTLETGKLRVAVYGANSLVENGTLLNLRFKVVGQMRGNSDLKWEAFQFNEGEPKVKTKDGKVLVKKGSQLDSTNFDDQ